LERQSAGISEDRYVEPAVRKKAEDESSRMGIGSWIIVIVLLSFLVATAVPIYFSSTLGDGVAFPVSTYIAMVLGVIVSLGVGVGLMALVFYSSRKGYDEPPVFIGPSKDAREGTGQSTEEPASEK
jgi:flagellar basal body-associated protein FliL